MKNLVNLLREKFRRAAINFCGLLQLDGNFFQRVERRGVQSFNAQFGLVALDVDSDCSKVFRVGDKLSRRFQIFKARLELVEVVNRKLHQSFVDDGIIFRGDFSNRLARRVKIFCAGVDVFRQNFFAADLNDALEAVKIFRDGFT